MYQEHVGRVIKLFIENRIEIKEGMSKNQIIIAQDFYGITFPPDLQELLMAFTPISNLFYNWCDYSHHNVEIIKNQIAWPIEGILFDVENNDFWLKSWGKKPANINEKLQIARKYMEQVPKLIPILSHRYISSYPNETQNPIYSVYQMDIIFYGKDIWDYFEVEFKKKKQQDIDFGKIKCVPFWHDIITNIDTVRL